MLVRLIGALAVALGLLAALPAGAAAQLSRDAQRVYDDYRSDAAIEPCDHTAATYRRTLREVTPDIEEETPAFRPAVEAALKQRRAQGADCDAESDPEPADGGSAGGTTGGATPPAQTAPPAPSPASAAPAPVAPAPGGQDAAPAPQATPTPTVAPPPPVTSSAPPAPVGPVLLDRPHEGTPAGVVIALGLLALCALLAGLALAARRFGWGEERLAGTRHAWGEAAYRASATWADFVDWIRLGRGPHRL